jgi:hypothetical protein
MFRFLVMKLIHLGLNHKFNMIVIFTTNYSFSGSRRPRRQRDVFDDRLRKSQNQTGLVFLDILIGVGYTCVCS